jgi:hypothetical protein
VATYKLHFARRVIMETYIEASSKEEAEGIAMDLETRGQLGLSFVTGETLVPRAHCSIVDEEDDAGYWHIELDSDGDIDDEYRDNPFNLEIT